MGRRSRLLRAPNNLKSTSLAVGQTLVIPGSSAPVKVSSKVNTVETKTVTHTVAKGDYLGKVANKYKVSVADIKRENNLKSDVLKLGQKLKITVSLKDLPLRKHKVQRGEFLGKIASKYGVTVQSIRDANKLRSDSLAVGQVLLIPNK